MLESGSRNGGESHAAGQAVADGPIDIQALKARGAKTRPEELRLELYDKVNRLGCAKADLTKVLDGEGDGLSDATRRTSGAYDFPTASATRHAHFVLDGSGPVFWDPRIWMRAEAEL